MKAIYRLKALLLFMLILFSACSGISPTKAPPVNISPSKILPPFPTYTPTTTIPPGSQTSEFPYAPILNEALPKDGLVLGAHVFADTDKVCYDVGIYDDDTYLVISCLVDFTYPAPGDTLDTNASAFLQRWLERFTGYEENSSYNHHMFIIFKGNGIITPDFAEKIALQHLIGNLEWKAHAYISGGGTPSAVPAAKRVLGEKIGVSPEAITVLKFEVVDFPDSCIGTPKPEEVCVQVVTQGFRIQLVALGLLYEYHTDTFGFDIRPFGDPQVAPTQGPGG